MDDRPANLRSLAPAKAATLPEPAPFAFTPDPDAPDGPVRTPGMVIKQTVASVVNVTQTEKPTDEQVQQMESLLTELMGLAERGYQRAQAAAKQGDGGGRGGGQGPLHWLLTIILGAGSALGISNLTDNGDAVASDTQDERITTVEADVKKFRYATGKLIEYQIQENYAMCTRDQAEARALNWIARSMPKSDDDVDLAASYEAIYVECEQNPLLPDDLTDLLTHARRVDNARR